MLFQPIFTSNFELRLLFVLYIVVDFNAPQTNLGLKLSTQETFKRV